MAVFKNTFMMHLSPKLFLYVVMWWNRPEPCTLMEGMQACWGSMSSTWWSWLFFYYKYLVGGQKSVWRSLFRAWTDRYGWRKINLQTTARWLGRHKVLSWEPIYGLGDGVLSWEPIQKAVGLDEWALKLLEWTNAPSASWTAHKALKCVVWGTGAQMRVAAVRMRREDGCRWRWWTRALGGSLVCKEWRS